MIDDVSNDGKTMTDGGNDMVLAGCMVNGCNEIFMQSQGVLAAENAKGAKLMPRSRPVEDP